MFPERFTERTHDSLQQEGEREGEGRKNILPKQAESRTEMYVGRIQREAAASTRNYDATHRR